jgi:hypothetical protein
MEIRFDDLYLLLAQRIEPSRAGAGADDGADRCASLPQRADDPPS